MSDYNFWQNIEGGWKQLKNWCLHKRSDTPSDSTEGGVWYNETSKRIDVDVGSVNKEVAYIDDIHSDIGVIDTVPPILTYNNNGTVTVASCNVRLYSNPDYNGLAKEYNVPSKTLTMTDGGDEIVIAHYNSGTPEYRLVNRVDINNYGNGDTAFIYRVWYAFGDFHSQSGDSLGLGLSNKVANRIANDKFYSRIGDTGLELSESTGHIVNITAANVYAGGVKIIVLPFTSSTDKFSIVYKNSSNVWQKQVATSYPNNLYNPDGQGLVTLPNNKFTAVYLYRTIGDDKECFAVIDNNYYNTVDVAVATSTKRTDIPNVVRSHCILVGRIVYESGSVSGKVQSVWLDPFTAGGIEQHNSLLDKDGGDTVLNYYGHVKQIHNTILENFGKASGAIVSDANNYIPIEQIPVGLLGGLTPKGAWNPATNTPTLSNPPLATSRGWFYIASTSGTALGTDWASTDWCISDGTVWQKIDNTDKVSSVFGRTGNVVAANGDYNLDQVNDGTTYKRITSTEKTNYNTAYTHSQTTGNAHSVSASQIPCAATGDISATNIQSAIAELDSEKLSTSTAATTYAPINTTLADNAANSTLPTTASGSMVSKIQQIRDYLKYLLAQIDSCFRLEPVTVSATTDWNDVVLAGSYRIVCPVPFSVTYNQPVGAYNYGQLKVFTGSNGQITQEYISNKVDGSVSSAIYRRIKYQAGSNWSIWVRDIVTDDLAGKQNTLTFDSAPTDGSTNPVTSYGVYDALADKVSKSVTADQSISSPLVTKKSIYNHRTAGTPGVAGHFKICTITITNNYANRPIEFTITQRSKLDSAKVSLLFQNNSGLTPYIDAFTYNSLSTYGIYAYGSATSIWEIYVSKSESYDNLEVSEFHDAQGQFPNIVWETSQVSAVPSGSIQAALATLINATNGNAATATKLATARNIALTGGVSGSANFDGSENISITATVAADSHNHVIANIDNLQNDLNSRVRHNTIGYYVASVGYYWCNIGAIYLETGKYNSVLLDYSGSFYRAQHWSYGLIFVQLNTGSTYPSIKLTKINTNSTATSLVSLYGDWNATTGMLTLWGAFGGGNSGGTIQCNLLSRTVNTASFSPNGSWQSATPTWTYQITADKQELTDAAPISHATSATTYGISTASNYGHSKASSSPPVMDGAASVGNDDGTYARGNHVHPTDTSRANKTYYDDDGTGKLTIKSGSTSKNIEISNGTTVAAYTTTDPTPLIYLNAPPVSANIAAAVTAGWVKKNPIKNITEINYTTTSINLTDCNPIIYITGAGNIFSGSNYIYFTGGYIGGTYTIVSNLTNPAVLKINLIGLGETNVGISYCATFSFLKIDSTNYIIV